MLRFLTAGESHGKALVAVVEGFPSGVHIDKTYIDSQLKKRQGGYGRGRRMKIESDTVEIISGVRHGITLGSPIAILIQNRDWENWEAVMDPLRAKTQDNRVVTRPRPGHADLSGALKYGHTDIRNTLERASARETAARMAVGALAKALLEHFGIHVFGHVTGIGKVLAQIDYNRLNRDLYKTPLYCTDEHATQEMIRAIESAGAEGDSLGGTFEVLAKNVPPGLGSHVHWDRRLDGRLARALMSIPGIKGVEIGIGFEAARLPGSAVHDEIFFDGDRGFYHKTNRCGGLEGGITNGEPVVVRAAMKPIPTLRKPLQSVDILTKQACRASVERSDTCAVPAAAVVGESVVAWEIAASFLEKFGGDSLDEVTASYENFMNFIRQV